MDIGNRIYYCGRTQRLLRTSIVSVLLFAIVGLFVFCLLVGFTHDMAQGMNMNQEQTSFGAHMDQMKIMSSASVIQPAFFSILSAILFVVALCALFAYSLATQLAVRPVVHRRYLHTDTTPAAQLERHWLSRFVRSPEILRPA